MRPRSAKVTRLLPLLIVAACAASLAGCDLMTEVPTPRPSRISATLPPVAEPDPTPTELEEVPTIRPEPSGGGPDLVEAANALADLDSYRVTIRARGLVPAISPNGQVTMTSTLVQGQDPAAAFTMTGVDGFVGGRLQAIVIGDRAWLREGSGSWKVSPGGAADFDAAFTTMSPIDLAAQFESLSPAIAKAATERRNGVRSIGYHTDAADDVATEAGLTQGRR